MSNSANLSIRYWENTTNKVCKKCGSKIQQKTWFEDFNDENTRTKLYRCSNHHCENNGPTKNVIEIADTRDYQEKNEENYKKVREEALKKSKKATKSAKKYKKTQKSNKK